MKLDSECAGASGRGARRKSRVSGRGLLRACFLGTPTMEPTPLMFDVWFDCPDPPTKNAPNLVDVSRMVVGAHTHYTHIITSRLNAWSRVALRFAHRQRVISLHAFICPSCQDLSVSDCAAPDDETDFFPRDNFFQMIPFHFAHGCPTRKTKRSPRANRLFLATCHLSLPRAHHRRGTWGKN